MGEVAKQASTEVTNLLEKCTKEVYNLYKGLIIVCIGVDYEQ